MASQRLRLPLVLSVIVFSFAPAGYGQEWLRTALRVVHEPLESAHRHKPPTGADAAVERLAVEIDWLEHHIDAYGSIVPKHPNVWGEARLTRHRDEYERILAAKLGEFDATLNGALRRSDQSYLAMALALQAAATGNPPLPTETTTVSNLITSGDAAISRSAPLSRTSAFTFEDPGNKISLEPTIFLDQMSRYLNHLHELRRINEGDDTADSPGYSLNLVRIPVSVLPGKKTRVGWGAEVTISAEPYLGDQLLPVTFRSLVINDAVDQVAVALTHFVNSAEAADYFAKEAEIEGRVQEFSRQENARPEELSRIRSYVYAESVADRAPLPALDPVRIAAQQLSQQRASLSQVLLEQRFVVSLSRSRRARLPFPPSQILEIYGNALAFAVAKQAYQAFQQDLVNHEIVHLTDVQALLETEKNAAYEWLSRPDCPINEPGAVVVEQDANPSIWMHCSPALVQAIRQRHTNQIEQLRETFLDCLVGTNRKDSRRYSTATASAWGLIVHSALLNDQLLQDIRESSAAKGCSLAAGSGEFFGPRPLAEARAAFNDYVRCRWPIHVFALDPVTQDQNIGDEFARRRETQLALALAFASGQVNAQTMTRFVRRLEWDMATIALNRTAVGFSHGQDTFGWRFYPRFQTPPIEGNLAAFGQTLFGGPSRDCDMSQRELESGMRECTAIVLMPSFVPYCTFNSRTNWFRLTNPAQTEVSMRDTMELSRAITAMRQSAAQCAQCAHLYRPGDIERLLRRVEQLDRELPLQQMQVQIPYENTAGGFELFNSGITDLAPELRGWYGAPGLHPGQPTTLYLVGDGFSVHDTRLLAGGQDIPFRMLSRQILEANFPAGLRVIPADNTDGKYFDAFVDVHLATPYGVSNYHLLIPVVRDDAFLGAADFRWNQPRISLTFEKKSDNTISFANFFEVHPRPIVVSVPPSVVPPASVTIKVGVYLNDILLGKVELTDVKFDARKSQYVLDETQLTSLIGTDDVAANKVRNLAKTYLQPQVAKGLQGEYILRLAGRIEAAGLALPILIADQIEVVLKKSVAVTD